MSDDTARTGELVRALADGVKQDLGDIAADLETVRLRIQRLGEDARAINGLGADCSGWADHLSTIVGEVKKEMVEIPSKLLGTPIREIQSSVNPEHAEAVRSARKGAA